MNGSQRREDAPDVRIRSWLESGPDLAPADLVESTLAPIPMMAQRRRSIVAFGRITVSLATLARYAVAAAVIVAVVALSARLLGSGPNGIGRASTPPAPAASSAVGPEGAAPASSSALPFADQMDPGMGSATGLAGTYRTRQFRPQLVFTVPAGWKVDNLLNTFVGGGESPTAIPISNGDGEIVVIAPTSIDPVAPAYLGSPAPSDLVGWIASNRAFVVSSTRQVTIAGIPGREFVATLAPDAPLDPGDVFYRPFAELPLVPRLEFRLAVITVRGTQVVVATVANADRFDAFVPEADAIIRTFAFPAA